MPAGRPMKFKSVDDLHNKINEYFASCWEEVWVFEQPKKIGGKGKWIQQFDRLGNPLMRLKDIPCITGLADHLDTTRRTLLDYEDGAYDTEGNEYSHAIKRAKAKCEYYAEQGTINGSIAPGAGVFILKNYGWTDKQEIDQNIGNKDGQPFKAKIDLGQLSDKELDTLESIIRKSTDT